MGKIVRLTESDLVRIVKRVINEGVAGPYTVGGLSYNVQTFGDGNIGYVSVKELIKNNLNPLFIELGVFIFMDIYFI
jgi:hypothetical protein